MEKKMRGLRHLYVTVFLWGFANFIVIPAITDVTMAALCPGLDECSLAIYITGIQQAIIGLGTMVMMPLIGNLSDHYGRKALLTLPMTLSIIPVAILAYSRTTIFFYAYCVLRTLTAMVCEGSTNCIALAYVADSIPDKKRASAFGVLSGVLSCSFVCGTLAARFLSTASTFQVATLASMLAAVYMRIFLEESVPNNGSLSQPILQDEPSVVQNHGEPPRRIPECRRIPSVRDLIYMLQSSASFSQAAVIAFFNSLADGGMQSSMLYFLKARFHFNKNQFADLFLISGFVGTISQLLLMPILVPHIGEGKLLSIGLLVTCTNAFLCSISWAAWVPYATAVCAIFMVFAPPCLRSIASKQVGPREQGKAQGCISGISSLANIISPLIFGPLTALFLSEKAPFDFPGFSLMCIGLASMVAFLQSMAIKSVTPTPSNKVEIDSIEA